MKRLTVLILGCLMFVGVGLSVFTPGTIEAATITWKMQTTWPSGMGLHTSAVDLAKRIEDLVTTPFLQLLDNPYLMEGN